MAKEATIRKHARNKMLTDGYTLSVPCRSRYGAFMNYYTAEDKERGDDLFGIYDMVGWKADEWRMIQYTSVSNMKAREKKILEFFEKTGVILPPCASSEVWGYKHGSGGEFEIEIVPE